jgi:micrococcal nuclease
VTTVLEATTTLTEPGVPTTTTTVVPPSSTSPAPATTTTIRPGVPTGPPVPGPSGDPSGPLPLGAEVVTVASITDGDTIDVVLADGAVATVRLIGTNSPESNECFGAESTLTLAALIPAGSMVGMTRDVSDLDDFGRLLRYLWVGSMSVNEESVRRGAAISRHYPPDTAMSERLDAAQDAARSAGLGLWSPTACGPASEASLNIVDVVFDAPGDDNENLNEEWVEVRNNGGSPVDLTGWGIKDESATHRYEFPASFTLASGESVTVRTGCGVDFGTELFWCSEGSAVWNNSGDTAFLLDPNGNTHDTFSYGESGLPST